ncbi:hypothetical protein E3N88_00111 [Mikania micrantha]|uniref:Disease resistance protein At4g27190-like leucine-rich repeats domain-containing protein n=1 Tax=Mikania micrantha TaxID=192012 RepID=A0A5N6PX50_9ASTR|nr:hypothetical protein E3N88_00111 [Mikania micrantha]
MVGDHKKVILDELKPMVDIPHRKKKLSKHEPVRREESVVMVFNNETVLVHNLIDLHMENDENLRRPCDSLEHVFTSSMVGGLLQLQDLQVTYCKNMEVIVKIEEEDEVKEEMELFPCLKSLKLIGLGSLKGFCSGKVNFSWPLLHTLEVPACPEITDMLLLQH